MRSGRATRIRLRTLSLAFAGLLVLLSVAAAVGATWTLRVAWRSEQVADDSTESIGTTREIERTLWEHNRLANLLAATEDPEVAQLRQMLESELGALLLELESETHDPTIAPAVARATREVGAYLSERQELSAAGLSVGQFVQALRPSVERALASVAHLRSEHDAALARARSEARRAAELQSVVMLGSIAVLLIGLAAVAVIARRTVVRPIAELAAAITRFRRGEVEVSVTPGRVTELAQLSTSFNEMTQMIAQQRREQLTFLAGVAHDLRNPLAALKAGVEALVLDPAMITSERLGRLDRQINMLTRMVGDLLDSARIESGELELVPEEVDLREIARSALEAYEAATTSHEVVLHAAEEPVVVRGDALRLEQVTGNLIGNAMKFSPPARRVDVSVSVEDGWAVLAVADQGRGIPDDEMESLFLPFRRRKLAADQSPGVGLGLSISRRIVLAHGGRIEVESAVGSGSTFRVRLPLSVATEESAPDLAETRG